MSNALPEARSELSFDSIWAIASQFDGWLTDDQARALWSGASQLAPGARVVEIGSHRGRSTAVLAAAVSNSSGRVAAIDPFDDPRWGGGAESQAVLVANLDRVQVGSVVDVIQSLSTVERPTWTKPIDFLYIDGAHDFATVSDDLKWSTFVRPSHLVAVHDGFSSVDVTRAILAQLLFTHRLRYSHRVGSLVFFVNERPTLASRALLAAQTWWFGRNLLVKVALRGGWQRVLRVLGHEGSGCPY